MSGTSGSPSRGSAIATFRRILASRWAGRWRRWGRAKPVAVPIAVALAAAIVASLAVHHIAFLTHAEQFVADIRIALRLPAEPQDRNIVILAVDEQTLSLFPYRSPIDRGFLADLIRQIEARAPRAIGVDILFDQPTEPAKDKALRQALAAASMPLVISYVDDPKLIDDEQKEFLDDFVKPADRGLANLAEDAFDTARAIYPGHAGPEGSYVPGFARALATKLGVASPPEEVEIAWHGRPDRNTKPFAMMPAQLIKLLPPGWFKDKIVLIGSDYSITDRHRTPFAAIYEGAQGNLPGVVVHAHSLAQLLDHRPPDHLGWLGNATIALALALIGSLLGGLEVELTTRIAAALFAVVLLWLVGSELFHENRVMIPLVTPTLALALALWMSDSLGGREARRQREFVTSTFSRYVSPKVVRQLVDSRAPLTLDGDRRIMTFLFTDIAGFTTLSETIESHKLAEMLNAYLDGVCRIVLKYDGMVDKFIGDAVFAIFNAPTEQADHPERAVRCALEIDEYAERFRRAQNDAGIALGVTRIGVHTGQATIGNFGSLLLKMDYTALGDAVNTASRLEGLNKYFGTRICVSDETRKRCEGIAFRPLGLVILKGKTVAHAVYEPLDAMATDAEYVSLYEEAYASLAQHSPAALSLFAALHARQPDDACVAMHLERLRGGETGAEIAMAEK
jgi:adenylate cyclase